MRIAFTISQLSGGGAERVVSLLSGAMAERNHEVYIITLIDCPIVYKLNPKVKLVCLNCCNSRVFGTLNQIIALHKEYIRISPDVIVSFLPVVNMTAIIANRGLKSKIIVSERNDPNQNPRKSLIRRSRDFLYKYADGYVFQTPDAKKYFEKITNNRGAVIANPITGKLPVFEGQRRKTIVTAVRLEPQKNLELLINAFVEVHNIYQDYTLEIYGDGCQRDYLQNYINSKGLNDYITLKGFQNNIHELIYDATAFVLSSNYEGISNSMIEALAMGIPVISTDHPIGGARMFIKDGVNGYLVPVNDMCKMAAAISKVIENPGVSKQIGINARKISCVLSLDSITDEWLKYINEVIEK